MMFLGWQTRLGLGGSCALLLVCALSFPASATQSPSSDTGAKTSTTSKTAHKSHKASAPASKTSATKKTSTAVHSTSTGKHSSHKKKSAKVKGQQKIDPERAQAIQEALIREHYLSGEPTGTWNQDSESAMRKYQADNGWQSKTVPDSRALIKLGLGPSKDHLLNPESAMTTVPDAPKASSLPTTSNSAPAAAQPVAPATSTSTPASTDSSSPQ